MKKLCIVLALVCLVGCSPNTDRPEKPGQQAEANTQEYDLYLYESDSRNLAIDVAGNVVMEIDDGQMSILSRDGRSVGISVERTEGRVTDEWGWVQPKHYRCDIYDVTGSFRYSLPVRYANLFDELIIGYNPSAGATQVYRWSDGKLLFDDVHAHYVLGETHFINQTAWESPGMFLNGDGTVLSKMPEQYTQIGSALDQYMIVAENGLQGLMDCNGTLVLPCEYLSITSTSEDCVFVQTESEWQALNPETGEILFRNDHSIHTLLEDCAIVAVGEEYGDYELVDLNGNRLLDRQFQWATVHYEGDKIIIEAPINDYFGRILFTTDGTILYETEDDGYLVILSDTKIMKSVYRSDATEWTIIDLEDGTEQAMDNSAGQYYYELYSTDGEEKGYLCCGKTNAQGWYRTDIVDLEGNVVLGDLQDYFYRGNGVFQCRLGFRSGLLRLDGTWLYEESTFSGLNDN